VNGAQATRPRHIGVVRRLELVGDVSLVEVDGEARRWVAAVAEASDWHRAAFGQSEGDHSRAAAVTAAAVGGVECRPSLQRLGQTTVGHDVNPFHRRCAHPAHTRCPPKHATTELSTNHRIKARK